MQVDLSPIGEDQAAQRCHRLRRRPDIDDRVALPWNGLVLVDVAAPDVHDGLAADLHRHGGSEVVAGVEIVGEHLLDLGEALVTGAVNVSHGGESY
jgi:hypothetical protein